MRKIGFGLENLGLLALRWPGLFALIAIVLSIGAVVGISRLTFNDDVISAFRSDTESFRQFNDLLADREGSSNDVIVMIEADRPFDAAELKRLREMHFEFEFAEGVGSVLSAFALREYDEDGEPGPPLIPDQFGDGDLPRILEKVRNNPFGFDRAISADHTAMVFVVTEDPPVVDEIGPRNFIEGIEAIGHRFETDETRISVLGLQVTRFAIADSILEDLIVFNAGGSLIAILVALAVFRSLRMTLLVVSSGTTALVWTLGAAGLANQPITVVTNIIPVLVIVISFTNSMHLVHSLRENATDFGEDTKGAIRDTIIRIGPACALTSLTTAAAFMSLSLTGYGALNDLAYFGAAAVMLSFLAIIVIFPLMALLLVRPGDIGVYRRRPGIAKVALEWLAAFIWPARRAIIAVAALALLAGVVGHLTTSPRFSTYDNLPRGSPILEASLRAEDRFGGLFNLWIRIAGKPDVLMTTKEGWKSISAVHRAAESVLGRNAVLSPLTLARATGKPDDPLSQSEIEEIPEAIRARIGETGDSYVTLSVMVGDPARSPSRLAQYDRLERAVLDAGATVVTGTPALARHDAMRMIENLNWSILMAAVTTIFLVAIAFRSLPLIPAIALANMTPVLLTGVALHLLLDGTTKIATGLAMTIAFGVAIDDTVHFINRAFIERDEGRNAFDSVRRAITGVGFVLCATTLVLGSGISLTWWSSFITVRLFGLLMVMILIFALIADLLILPATMLIYKRWHRP